MLIVTAHIDVQVMNTVHGLQLCAVCLQGCTPHPLHFPRALHATCLESSLWRTGCPSRAPQCASSKGHWRNNNIWLLARPFSRVNAPPAPYEPSMRYLLRTWQLPLCGLFGFIAMAPTIVTVLLLLSSSCY